LEGTWGGGGVARKLSKSFEIAVLKKGEFFGEVEIFNDIARTHNALALTPCSLLVLQKQTMSGETLPQKMLESIFRYASMRAQWRNSRLTLILESLGVLEWQMEREIKLALEPDLKPLARMRISALPVDGNAASSWLSSHTVVSKDAREWGMYHYGAWAAGSQEERMGTAGSKAGTSAPASPSSPSTASPKHAPAIMASPTSRASFGNSSLSPASRAAAEKVTFFVRYTGGPAVEKWH